MGGARAQEKRKWMKHNSCVNLPRESLYGSGRLHIQMMCESLRRVVGLATCQECWADPWTPRRHLLLWHWDTWFFPPPFCAWVSSFNDGQLCVIFAQEKVSHTYKWWDYKRCLRAPGRLRPHSLWRLEGWRRLKDTKNRIRYCAV